MKNLVIVVLLITTVAFGGLYWRQAQKTDAVRAEAAALREQIADKDAELAKQEDVVAGLRGRLEDSRADALSRVSQTKELQQALTATQAEAKTNAKPANPLAAMASMLNNPEMREMIRKQQRSAFDLTFDKSYGKLFADMRLSPEQSAALKEMIWNKQTAGADLGFSMLSENLDSAKRAELVQQVRTDRDAVDAQIKQAIGDENFAKLQDFEKTKADRSAVSGFKHELGEGARLSGDQESQLLQMLTQERQGFKFSTDFSEDSKFNGDFTTLFSDERIDRHMQEQEQLNQQYLARAKEFLSPEQYESFQKYLEHQLETQKMGMKMAGKMFGTKTAGSGN